MWEVKPLSTGNKLCSLLTGRELRTETQPSILESLWSQPLKSLSRYFCVQILARWDWGMLSTGSHSGAGSSELPGASETTSQERNLWPAHSKVLGLHSFLGSTFTAALSSALPFPLLAFGLGNETQEMAQLVRCLPSKRLSLRPLSCGEENLF